MWCKPGIIKLWYPILVTYVTVTYVTKKKCVWEAYSMMIDPSIVIPLMLAPAIMANVAWILMTL